MSPAARSLDPDALAALEEQRDFLLRSIEDLDRELAAGDIEPDDHATLRDDYTARAADVIRAIDAQKAGFAEAKRPRSLGRTLAIVGGIAVFALLAGLAVAGALGARKPGESATGGISVQQSPSQRANECIPKIQSDAQAALECFEAVREDDPKNAVALTWEAWLFSLTSAQVTDPAEKAVLQARAAVFLDDAVESDSRYSYARAFRAIVAYRNGRYEDAQQYLEEFQANDPSAEAARIIEQQGLEQKIADALAGAGEGDATPDGSASTTTTVDGG